MTSWLKKERYYIESIDCVNKIIPGKKLKEWHKQNYENNKEVLLTGMKEYYENNKEKIQCSKCGSGVVKKGLLKHQRTIKCQNTADILLEIKELN